MAEAAMVGSDVLNPRIRDHRCSGILMKIGEEGGYRRARHPRQQPWRGFDHGDILAGLRQRRRHFQPDISPADHDCRRCFGGGAAQACRVIRMTKFENAVHAFGGGKPARCRPHGKNQPVIGDALARGRLDLPRIGVNGRHPAAIDQLDIVVCEPVRLAKRKAPVILAVSGKKRLGQGRAFQRLPDQGVKKHQLAIKPVAAHGIDETDARMAGSNDNHTHGR